LESPYLTGNVTEGSIVASGKMLLSNDAIAPLEERHDECFDKLINHLKSKRELLEVLRPRYLKADKVEKQKMLDEFTPVIGYHRKHAIRVLKNKR
jgi:hypothetical protein